MRKRILLATLLLSAPVAAQSAGDYQRPWGTDSNAQTQPYAAGTRDQNGNRVIVNGVMQTGVGVQAQMNGTGGVGNSQSGTGSTSLSSWGPDSSATAIGNQLNVIVNGNYNTVIVNSTQTNNGDVNATSSSGGGEDENGDAN